MSGGVGGEEHGICLGRYPEYHGPTAHDVILSPALEEREDSQMVCFAELLQDELFSLEGVACGHCS